MHAPKLAKTSVTKKVDFKETTMGFYRDKIAGDIANSFQRVMVTC